MEHLKKLLFNKASTKYELIQQRFDSDCGIACLAMLTKQDYDTVYDDLFDWGLMESPDNLGMSYYDMEYALMMYGFDCRTFRTFERWKEIPCTTLATTNWSDDGMMGHWVVYVKTAFVSYMLNPAKDKKTENFSGYDTGHYMNIIW